MFLPFDACVPTPLRKQPSLLPVAGNQPDLSPMTLVPSLSAKATLLTATQPLLLRLPLLLPPAAALAQVVALAWLQLRLQLQSGCGSGCGSAVAPAVAPAVVLAAAPAVAPALLPAGLAAALAEILLRYGSGCDSGVVRLRPQLVSLPLRGLDFENIVSCALLHFVSSVAVSVFYFDFGSVDLI